MIGNFIKSTIDGIAKGTAAWERRYREGGGLDFLGMCNSLALLLAVLLGVFATAAYAMIALFGWLWTFNSSLAILVAVLSISSIGAITWWHKNTL